MGSTGARFYLENITFANTTATYSPAIYLVGSRIRIVDSKFINLKANMTAGAMSLREGGELYIENCEFINTTSSRNAGAIYVDITGYNPGNEGNVTIIDSKFKGTSSGFAGAYVQLGGQFWLSNSEFINNHATFNGGAIYLSFTETEISNCTFESDGVDVIEGYPTYGGAIFSDISTLNITDSKFFNNVAGEGNAIYAYDSSFNIKGSTFKNNANALFSVFTKEGNIDESTVLNNDTVSTNNTFYATIMTGEGLQLTLVNNTINVDTLPSKFDLRDWGWVSSVRDQGWMGACWTFGMTGALESALLKATGIPFNVSMNNMKTVMKYSPYGAMEVFEGGANLASVGYLLSWLGAIPYEADTYDELGKITMPIATGQNIQVQDMIFIPNNEIPNGTQIKLAILKYGALDVSFFGQSSYDDEVPYYNPKTYAQYVDVPETANHEVSIIGWDDNFPKEKFLITPPGNGAWIVKNSYGTEWGDNGFLYVSYYDQSLLAYKPGKVTDYAVAAIIENTVPYNKNYQYDITWLSNFEPSDGNISYMNVFEALDDDLIAGVGTYFNESGVSYTVEIYVNDELKLTQEGVSPYVGYHTIKLDSYIPIKKGDVFKAAITSNWVPYLLLEDTRVHYTNNISFISFDGETWYDAYDLGYIACLKVYTVSLKDASVSVNNDTVDLFVGDTFAIVATTVPEGLNVTYVPDDSGVVSVDENGVVTALKEGTATILVKVGDGRVFAENSTEVFVTVKAKANMIIDAVYDSDNDEIVATITNNVTGKPVSNARVVIELDGVNTTVVSDKKGQAKLSTADLTQGTHTATISYKGNSKYNPASTSIEFVKKADMIISAEYDAGSNEIVATITNGITGKPISNARVVIELDGVNTTVVSDKKGQVKVSTADLTQGTHTATISYKGNSKYNPANTTLEFTVKNNIIISDIYTDSNELVATLTNDATGKGISNAKVNVKINGVTTTVKTNSKGKIKVSTADLNDTAITATISYNGNSKYNPASITTTTDLEKANIIITYVYDADSQKVVATLKNSKTGKAVSSANVIVDLDGVKTTIKSDSKGQITYSTADLAAGTHVGTISYGGNSKYNPISAVFSVDI